MENVIDAKNDTQWKVWIDAATNKLHVHGEIKVQDAGLIYELGKTDQGYLKEELLLEITPKLAAGNQQVSIKYHEELNNSHKYNKVTIKSGAEEVASLPVK